MAKTTKVVSIAVPHKTLRAVDLLARNDGRSRSAFITRALDRAVSDSTRKPMQDHDSKLGRVPDARLDRHGSVPRPAERPRGITGSKDGELLDSKLRHIPDVKREF